MTEKFYTIYTSTNVHEKRIGSTKDVWQLIFNSKTTKKMVDKVVASEKNVSIQVFQGNGLGKLVYEKYV